MQRATQREGVAGPSARSYGSSLAALLLRRLWDRRVDAWEHHASVGLEKVVAAVIDTAQGAPGMAGVDLGAGGGQLALPLARLGVKMTAVDISPRMIDALQEKAKAEGLDVDTVVAPAQEVSFAPASLDLVVSNYAFHHLRDEDKRSVVAAAAGWLRPGGRLVIGDMMFGRGMNKRDREIIGSKVRLLLQRGPAGWWRVAKNAMRFTFRMRERPLPLDTWVGILEAAGLSEVRAVPVVSEAAVVTGVQTAGH